MIEVRFDYGLVLSQINNDTFQEVVFENSCIPTTVYNLNPEKRSSDDEIEFKFDFSSGGQKRSFVLLYIPKSQNLVVYEKGLSSKNSRSMSLEEWKIECLLCHKKRKKSKRIRQNIVRGDLQSIVQDLKEVEDANQ